MKKFNILSKRLTTLAISASMVATMPGMANIAHANINQQEVENVAEIDGVGYATLEEAFENAESGNEIILLSDAEVNKMILVDKELTLNMGDGNLILFKEDAIDTSKKLGNITIEGGSLTIDGCGYIEEENPYYAPLMLKGATDSNAEDYSVLTVGEDVSLHGWSGIFVRQNGNAAYGVKIEMNGSASSGTDGDSSGSAIYVNGSITETEGNIPEIVIGENANLSSDDSTCLYLAGYADTYVYGNLNGCESGVEIRAGKLTIEDGAEISSTYVPTEEESNGNGSAIDGAAIAIAQHTTKLPIEVSVNGGNISGYTALYQADPEGNNDSENITIDVSGGSFEVIDDSDTIIYSEDKTGFISGGTYSIKPDEKYIADGYAISESDDGFEVVDEADIEGGFDGDDDLEDEFITIEGPENKEIFAGETIQLYVSTKGYVENIIWRSSNEKVAFVDENGFVRVVGKSGTATITAKVEGTNEEARCRIEVKKQFLDTEDLALASDVERTLEINGDFTMVEWTSSDESVVTVNEDGVVKAVGTGSAIVTAKVNDIVTLNCTVVVTKKSVDNTYSNIESDMDLSDKISDIIDNIEIPEDVEDEDEYIEEVEIAVESALDEIAYELQINSIAKAPADDLIEAAKDALIDQVLEDGDKALIYANVELLDIEANVEVNNEDDEITANAVITSLTFKINPMIKIFDEDGNLKGEAQEVENDKLTGTFKIYLPIPSSVTSEYVNIVHTSDEYPEETYHLPILTKDEEKYVEMTLEHFSTFEVTFTDEEPDNGDDNDGDEDVVIPDPGPNPNPNPNPDTDDNENEDDETEKEHTSSNAIKGSYGSSKYSSGKKVENKNNKVNGKWVCDENGWWFCYEDGTWPAGKFVDLEWNGKVDTYYFDANGYMHTGWLLKDGLWYYLHPTSDGTKGHMYTGWKMIDGIWYCFNDGPISTLGSLFVNTTTPDGYKVDLNGAWIQ